MTGTPINIKSLDFENFKTELIEYIKNKTPFTDVDFDGSNANYLADILAYCTNFFGWIAQAAISETLISEVVLRNDAIAISRNLNYYPRKIVPASAYVTLKIEDPYLIQSDFPSFDPLTDTVLVPAYSIFSASEGYQFVTLQDYTLSPSNEFSLTVKVYEGTWVADEVLGTATGEANQIYEIQVENITDYLDVVIGVDNWTNQNDTTYWGPDSLYYQFKENYREYYDIEFGDGLLGFIPENGETITISYLKSSGADGNKKSSFSLIGSGYINGDTAQEVDNTSFTTIDIQRSTGGKDVESLSSIKLNAPKWWASQNKTITKSDYDVILRQHSLVEYLNVFGGDELNPPKYGFVVATIKPPGADFLTTEEKDELKAFLNDYHVMGIRFDIKDPVYVYFRFDVHHNYNLKFYSGTEVLSASRTTLYNFFENIQEEGTDFYFSKLLGDLDDTQGVISSRVTLTNYIKIDDSVDDGYFFNFGQPIKEGSLDLTFDTTKGFYDDGGIIYNRTDDEAIGTIDYEKGIINISDYSDVTSEQKVYLEFEYNDIFLYQNLLFIYDDVNSTFLSTGLRK